ncbi:MAG: hypothetical protein J6R22_04995 [Alphaproteobacteria bacterium]|nr:hypothetical protein [Alphaproteobacteria bacterium]
MATKKTETTKAAETQAITPTQITESETAIPAAAPILTLTTEVTTKTISASIDVLDTEPVHDLGTVSPENALKLIETFAIATPAKNACVIHGVARLKETGVFGMSYRGRGLEISFNQFSNNAPLCTPDEKKFKAIINAQKPKKASDMTAARQATIEKAISECSKHCFSHLKSGKCTDEFIRNTLGVIFFPKHYAKQNGKQK